MEQSETLKYLYLLFSDQNILPFEGERYSAIYLVRGVLIDVSLILDALPCRLRVQH